MLRNVKNHKSLVCLIGAIAGVVFLANVYVVQTMALWCQCGHDTCACPWDNHCGGQTISSCGHAGCPGAACACAEDCIHGGGANDCLNNTRSCGCGLWECGCAANYCSNATTWDCSEIPGTGNCNNIP